MGQRTMLGSSCRSQNIPSIYERLGTKRERPVIGAYFVCGFRFQLLEDLLRLRFGCGAHDGVPNTNY